MNLVESTAYWKDKFRTERKLNILLVMLLLLFVSVQVWYVKDVNDHYIRIDRITSITADTTTGITTYVAGPNR